MLSPAPAESVSVHGDDLAYLHDRMQKPQRHRLLHGYPLAAAMPHRAASVPGEEIVFDPGAGRGLLMGVLPHPFCNPTVKGCGFCTFPHQAYSSTAATAVAEHVALEIRQRVERQPYLYSRPVTALYVGGATANLTPAEPFRRLCRQLAETFDLTHAEVTLEGVPAYFVKRQPLLADILRDELPARHFRLSMGIQTFDEDQLRRMGRLTFGTPTTFRQVVELAHYRGFTVSADLLFNLPGQTPDAMKVDLAQADSCGLDHLGLYHLVLFRGLGTTWSRDAELLASLPDNRQAAENWLSLREDLLARGFLQTTLTNFERAEFHKSKRRFLYEECSFQPDRFDMIGFGPSAISYCSETSCHGALKVLNPDGATEYLAAVARSEPVWDRSFTYGPRDLHVFYLTRRLAGLTIHRSAYRGRFGVDPLEDFPAEFSALQIAGLVQATTNWIRPTPRGMFYADSIAALLAWRQIQKFRNRPLTNQPRVQRQPNVDGRDNRANDNGIGYM
jgi:oxygen-independent coproporphyrinogen-3 oxidase